MRASRPSMPDKKAGDGTVIGLIAVAAGIVAILALMAMSFT